MNPLVVKSPKKLREKLVVSNYLVVTMYLVVRNYLVVTMYNKILKFYSNLRPLIGSKSEKPKSL